MSKAGVSGMAQLEPLTISVEETIRVTNLSRATIYLLIRQKRLKVTKVFSRTLVDYQSVKALVATGV
jgi:excisionase family DNA binding protein